LNTKYLFSSQKEMRRRESKVGDSPRCIVGVGMGQEFQLGGGDEKGGVRMTRGGHSETREGENRRIWEQSGASGPPPHVQKKKTLT